MPPQKSKATKTSQILLAATSLDEATLCEAIEARRRFIKPHLDEFTLGTVLDVPCLTQGEELKPIGSPMGVSIATPGGASAFSDRTQGIFGYSNNSKTFKQPGRNSNGTCWIWGLSRKGEWFLTVVDFEDCGQDGGKQQRARKLIIYKAPSLLELCAIARVTPIQVFYGLSRAVDSWVAKRKALLAKAEKIQRTTDIEDTLMMAKVEELA